MNKDKSLEEIDIIKLLAYALIFVITSTSMIFIFIVPSIKEYKIVKLQNNDRNINLTKIEQAYETESKNLTDLKESNKVILTSFSNNFDESKFTKKTSTFFSNVRLKRLPKISKNENFLRYELKITGTIKSPSNFYNFLAFLNNYENIIKVDFPISMKGNGEDIDTSFNIKVYTAQALIANEG